MNDKGVCRTAPATQGLLKIINQFAERKTNYFESAPSNTLRPFSAIKFFFSTVIKNAFSNVCKFCTQKCADIVKQSDFPADWNRLSEHVSQQPIWDLRMLSSLPQSPAIKQLLNHTTSLTKLILYWCYF